MAAKSPAAKKAKTARSTKSSKTTKARSRYTAAQQQAYNRAFNSALKSSVRAQRANTIAQHRIQAAASRLRQRNRFVQRRIQGRIVRNTYLQARYGIQSGPASVVPLKSPLRKLSSIRSYLQAHYGQKTYALTSAKGSVRVFPRQKRVARGRVVAANQRAVSKAATNRSAIAAGQRAARAVPASQKAHRVRKAPRHLKSVTDTPWITAGNDEGTENCVVVAIANSLLYNLGFRVADEQLEFVRDQRINKALWRIWHDEPWQLVDLLWYRWTDEPQPGDIIGFETDNGPHCGILLPGNKVVSWGEVIPLESEIEEAWTLKWMMTG